jgi:Lipid A 3-O-deacylase (PagL)
VTLSSRLREIVVAGVLLAGALPTRAAAQDATADTRTQYPALLANSYFSVNVGWLQDSFSERQLEPGFRAASVESPHAAARVVLFGHEFTRLWSAQLTYMRPVRFVSYRDVNGDAAGHHVWTGFGGATVKGRAPVAGRTSLYGEAGLGIASRHGFSHDSIPVVRDDTHASVLLGGGVEYRVGPAWDLVAGVTYIPGSSASRDAHTLMIDAGFRYTMRPLPPDRVEAHRDSGFLFRERLVQIEYSTGTGYSINTFLSTRVPVFWKGDVQTGSGIAVHYEQNVFHTAKIFALDIGASASEWQTRTLHRDFVTLSAYPVFRFIPVRTKRADAYFCYSLAGPTFITTSTLEGRDLGSRFTFQDFMGAGLLLGAAKHVTVGVKINHYSNGNLFSENAGVMVPITWTLGWAF